MPPSVPPDAPGYERDAEDLQVLCCRRTTLEWVFRRCALAEPDVRFQVGVGVAGLLVGDGGAAARSTSAACASTTAPSCAADVVVASTGRRGDVPGWFAEHGVEVPEEEHPTGTIYLSRFYRSADGRRGADGLPGRSPGRARVRGGRRRQRHLLGHPRRATPTTPSCAPTCSTPTGSRRCCRCSARWSRSCRSGGTPITPVQAMGGLINRIRRFVDADGAPLAHGFFAIGDAHTCTNPLYGRGLVAGRAPGDRSWPTRSPPTPTTATPRRAPTRRPAPSGSSRGSTSRS